MRALNVIRVYHDEENIYDAHMHIQVWKWLGLVDKVEVEKGFKFAMAKSRKTEEDPMTVVYTL